MGIETLGIGSMVGMLGGAAGAAGGIAGMFGGGGKTPEHVSAYQIDANNQANAAQNRAFDYQKSLQEPFVAGGMPAYYQMVSAITGKPQEYADPSYKPFSEQERNEYAWSQVQQNPSLIYSDKNFMRGIQAGLDPVALVGATPSLRKLGEGFYRGPNGEVTTTPPTIKTEIWNPTETPAYQWQAGQLDKNMNRQLAARGRSNSTAGIQAMGQAYGNLGAAEYDKQLGRLADLSNMARGTASNLASASTGYGNNMANQANAYGNNMTNMQLANNASNQNSLYNNQQNLFSGLNTGIKALGAFV